VPSREGIPNKLTSECKRIIEKLFDCINDREIEQMADKIKQEPMTFLQLLKISMPKSMTVDANINHTGLQENPLYKALEKYIENECKK